MQTQLQTVEIHLPNETTYEVEFAPVAPAPGKIKVKNDSVTTWSKHHIQEVLSNGTIKIWRPKPTMADIVTSHNKGRFVQFFKDGSILMRDGHNSFWGPTAPRPPVLGIIVHSHVCLNGYELFNDESDCFCETRVPLEEQRYSFWS